ncbi:MAG: citramalate synthase [Firmicutes bacterium]|nr:citramalate synthase [Bacillota bacterium]
MEKEIILYDTTLRDGTQGEGISFSCEDKLRIARRLDALGITYIEGGWPGSNPKDIAFFQEAAKIRWQNATITAFGSTRRPGIKPSEDKNLAAILDSGVKVATIFGKSWDFHVTNALRTTLEENLAMITESISFLTSHGLEVFFDAEHFFDGFKANPDYALRTLQAAVKGGAKCLILCDTNGGTLPSEIGRIIQQLGDLEVPLGIHAHNDSGVAVANTLVAVEHGARQVQGTINGIGERAGNADLCSVIPNLQLKMGFDCLSPEQLATLTKTSRFVWELANTHPIPGQPFVGRSVFAHKGGIHVSALRRHPETYEHIPPEKVGNSRRVLVSELSGSSNILYKLDEYGLDAESAPFSPNRLVSIIKEMENQGYYFEGAEASFEILLKKALGLYEKLFELIGFRLIIEKRSADEEPLAEATIKVKVGEQVIHTVAEGNGPVNALDAALRKALAKVYPQISQIHLTDYKVRVLDEKSGTGAKVRVLIESSDNGRAWGTVGVSTNIIEASWRALVDSIDYGLRLVESQKLATTNSE